jgi:hypothetical protein
MLYAKPDGKFYSYHDLTGELPLSGSGSSDSFLPMDLTGAVSGDGVYLEIVGTDSIFKKATLTAQEFTGSTSLTLTLSHTIIAGKPVYVMYNGLEMDSAAFSASGTTVTLSGLTRETADRIKVKYSY